MSRRPIPAVEDDVPIERGVGPVAEQVAPAAAPPQEDAPGPGDEQAPAAPGTAAGPDGSFTVANPGGTQLVPTAPATPTPAAPPPGGQTGGGAQQGAVYERHRPQRPHAEDIIRPKEETPREQVSAMVPAELELVRRMRLMWAHEGILQRDQVALALDAWLRDRGY